MSEAPPAIEEQFGVPRCRNCYYVLENLPEPRCPECGRPFDFNNPETYTIKPPLVRWRLWLPGLALAVGGGVALYVSIIPFAGFGWAATLVVPAGVGAIVGYCCRVRLFLLIAVSLIAAAGVFTAILSLNYAGLLCGAMLAGIALGPLIIGTLLGAGLRQALKNSRFDQRWHLPLIAFLLVPEAVATYEVVTYRREPPESVSTAVVINGPPEAAWGSIQFLEQVRHDPPPLLRLGMPRVLYSVGRAAAVGDLRTCVYDKGRLTKRVTEVRPNELLAFRVVEQGFERHAMTLYGGSFAFEPAGDSAHTRVTLTTTYRSHLSPRWCWRPFELYTVHTLHRHILGGMAGDAVKAESKPGGETAVAAGEEGRR